jgi:hypothetical protein
MGITVFPLTASRWDDFEFLSGTRGACGGCWCAYWKLTNKEFQAGKGNANHWLQKKIVHSGKIPGLLAYADGVPAGWVAVEPRQDYPRLAHSRILASPDDLPVWSVPCFFISRQFRRQGLTLTLLRAAIDHVTLMGGTILEGYPVDPGINRNMPPVFAYTGVYSAFMKVGFIEVARRSPTRPIMRYTIVK